MRASGGAGDLRLDSLTDAGTICADDAADSDMELHSNDLVHIHLDDDSNSTSMFQVLNDADTVVFSIDESGNMTGGTHSHDDYQPQIVIEESFNDAEVFLHDSCTNYGLVSINATGAGRVIVEANVWVKLYHEEGLEDHLVLGIDVTDADCGTEFDQVNWDIPDLYPEALDVNRTFTVRRMFQVDSDGNYDYFLNGIMPSGRRHRRHGQVPSRQHARRVLSGLGATQGEHLS
jgi:hypothetical protein